MFVRTSDMWSRRSELSLPDGRRYDFFAGSVGISGTTVLMGAQGRSQATDAAYMFVRLPGVPVAG